jgi:hypothetical protein
MRKTKSQLSWCLAAAAPCLMESLNLLTTILDSGASNHMLNSLAFFTETVPIHIFIVTDDRKSRDELVEMKKGIAKIQLANG